ncbi:hypothetical protein AAFF_G00220230 [Aldrovandia affinis]|uniref:Uncharacterized protein n=1 Tax=Aldrovandia affinis TaxID=143900 RepID=A0AAD7RFT4_9TELE|nr:hypothetical protein AAFF_G00220230 [Aldrovandia affinis]
MFSFVDIRLALLLAATVLLARGQGEDDVTGSSCTLDGQLYNDKDKFLSVNAAQSALTTALRIHRDPKVTLAPRVTGVSLVLLEMMASQASPAFPALPALPDPPALAETFLLKCLTAMMRSPAVEWQCPVPWVPWVPVVPLAPLVLPDPKVSQATLESLVSPALLVLWVPVVQLAPPERTEMMVRQESLVAPVSVVHLALRELVDSPEPPDFPASRDTEASVVWMELRETLALLDPRERLVPLVRMVLLV